MDPTRAGDDGDLPVREIPVEVLPATGQGPRGRTTVRGGATTDVELVMRVVAHVMDDLFQIPGTRFRIGLDPLLGLVPGIGDALAGMISAAVVAFAARSLPRIIVARMALNIAINAVLGAVPVFGDLFSFWFKSNARNARLIRQALDRPRRSNGDHWLFVVGIIALVVAGFALGLMALTRLVAWLLGL